MSKHLLQSVADLATANERISELEAALESANEELRSWREAPAPVDGHELAAVIGRGLVKAKDELIEGFTGKFAVQLLDSTGMVKQGVKENREQLEQAEQKTEALEERLRTVSAEISGLLDEATARLAGAFESHHARNAASIETFADKTNAINAAAIKIAEVVRLCGNFKQDYEKTATLAKISMNYTRDTLDDLVVQLRGEVKSIIEQSEALEAQRTRYILFIAGAFMIGALFGVLIALIAFLLK